MSATEQFSDPVSEMMVIAGLLWGVPAALDAFAALSPDDFTFRECRDAFATIREAAAAGLPDPAELRALVASARFQTHAPSPLVANATAVPDPDEVLSRFRGFLDSAKSAKETRGALWNVAELAMRRNLAKALRSALSRVGDRGMDPCDIGRTLAMASLDAVGLTPVFPTMNSRPRVPPSPFVQRRTGHQALGDADDEADLSRRRDRASERFETLGPDRISALDEPRVVGDDVGHDRVVGASSRVALGERDLLLATGFAPSAAPHAMVHAFANALSSLPDGVIEGATVADVAMFFGGDSVADDDTRVVVMDLQARTRQESEIDAAVYIVPGAAHATVQLALLVRKPRRSADGRASDGELAV